MPKPWQRQLFSEARPSSGTGANSRGAPLAGERVDVKLWLLDDSGAKAVHFLVAAEPDARRVWVARSLMGDRISKKKDPGCAFWRWEFTLPRWKAEDLGIDYS